MALVESRQTARARRAASHGHVILHAGSAHEPAGVAWYARVSSGDQKADWNRQLSRWAEFSAKHVGLTPNSRANSVTLSSYALRLSVETFGSISSVSLCSSFPCKVCPSGVSQFKGSFHFFLKSPRPSLQAGFEISTSRPMRFEPFL